MRRGEIWWADFPGPAGRRPVVLVSRDDAYAVRDFVMIAPVTTRVRGLLAEVSLGPEEGLPKPSVVNLDSLDTVAKRYLMQRVGALSASKLQQVEKALAFSLGLPAFV